MHRKNTEPYVEDIITPYHKVKIGVNTEIICKKYTVLMHKIDQLRDINTPSSVFRIIVEEVTTIMACHATRNIDLEKFEMETPICKMVGHRIAGKKMVIAPILRAGLGMEPAVKRLFPQARTGHIGFYRDEITLDPVEYFWIMPDRVEEREIFVLDPMLATGGTADLAITKLKEVGCKSIHFLCILAAPQGVDRIQVKHPDVHLHVGCMDFGLDKDGYIVPGLGDAGDRIFGTK